MTHKVSTVTSDDDGLALRAAGHGGEDGLDEVLGVVLLLEHLDLLPQTGRPGLLARERLGGDAGDFGRPACQRLHLPGVLQRGCGTRLTWCRALLVREWGADGADSTLRRRRRLRKETSARHRRCRHVANPERAPRHKADWLCSGRDAQLHWFSTSTRRGVLLGAPSHSVSLFTDTARERRRHYESLFCSFRGCEFPGYRTEFEFTEIYHTCIIRSERPNNRRAREL